MPGFDFSNAKLRKWDVNLPSNGLLFLFESSWDQGEFLAHFYSLSGQANGKRLFLMHRLTCKPAFALLEQDESNSLTVGSRMAKLGLKACHLIVDESEWVKSFEVSEPYGFSNSNPPIVHYMVNCGNDCFSLLSGNEPMVTELGVAEETEMDSLLSCNGVLASRLDKIVRPLSEHKSLQ